MVDLLTNWSGYKEYKKSAHEDLLFPRFLWQLFLIHLDLFSQEDFQKIIQVFIGNQENYKSSIFNVNQEFSLWFGDNPLTLIATKMAECAGVGLDERNLENNTLMLFYYFQDKKKLINLDLFAEKFSSLMLKMQQDFLDFFLKSSFKDKTEEIDFLYFLCSSQFNSQVSIDENTIFNVLSNAFRMNYDLKIFSENNLFFNKIVSYFVSLLDRLLSSSSLDKKTVNRIKTKLKDFLHLFFDFSQEETQYSEIKITFFTKIYAALSDDQKNISDYCALRT